MNESLVLSADLFKYWHVDFERGKIRIECQDGQIFEERLEPRHQQENSLVASSTFDWERWWIISTTSKNDVIITEGFNPASPPPLNGRPSVYLDQNHWRTVADAVRNPDRVEDPDERLAAQDLIRLATDAGIVLPLSAGHLIETAGLNGHRRYEIGVVMAQLAGGWQFRNPLDLWKYDCEVSIREHLGLTEEAPVLHPIVTEPGALFRRDTSLGITEKSSEQDKFMAMLTMPSVVLDILTDPDRIPKDPLSKWVTHHASITEQIHGEGLPKEQRRRLARRRYWNENISFYKAAYRRLTRTADFPTFSDSELSRLFSTQPMVGLVSELFIRRFTDHMTKWRRNDLVDMFHLSSAAGYANYVCAEGHTGTQLRDAQRALGRPETVFTNLNDMVTAIRRDGVRTESERTEAG
ncbi:hypothetical protein [Corynebacterium sputi]|uniref:hypothetical protein n=1 Tax=Corynebacterium sputi TaxID=489915 RepID=UPI00040EC926|nr:hypothetical protein [Corynebacterium sputi]